MSRHSPGLLVWEDLRFPATAINPPGAASDPDWDASNGGWLFDAGGTEVLYVLAQLPHSWAEGTTLHPHVHWEKSTSAAGNVLWQLRYQWSPIGKVRESLVTLNSTTVKFPSTDPNTANLQMITELGHIQATGKNVSDMLVMRLERVGGNAADTYGADARLLEFDIHFQKNALGSEIEYTRIQK